MEKGKSCRGFSRIRADKDRALPIRVNPRPFCLFSVFCVVKSGLFVATLPDGRVSSGGTTLRRMITRLTGTLESIEQGRAVVVVGETGPGGGGAGFAYEVLVPAFLSVELAPRAGQRITLHTIQYLEGQGQGTSFIPRLVGFASVLDRAFFDVFTSVSGIGNRKALRAMTQKPAIIARAIHEKDARLLATLPEIGKRMAERVIAELDGKVDAFLVAGEASIAGGRVETKPLARLSGDPIHEDAIAALMTLGQTRGEAEENVTKATARAAKAGKKLGTPDAVVEAVFGG
jgi:Holliday junction DNA helicase RuvA